MDGYFLAGALRRAPDRIPPWDAGLREWITLLAYLRLRKRTQQRRTQPAREERAWALHQEGVSWAAIGRALGTSGPTAQQWALRAELRARGDAPPQRPRPSLISPLTEAEAHVVHWREMGVTWIEIARRLGCTLAQAQEIGRATHYKQLRAQREETSRRLAHARRLSLARAELSLQDAYLALLQSRGRAVVRSPVIEVGHMARGLIPLYPRHVYGGGDAPPRDNETRDAIQEVLDDAGP